MPVHINPNGYFLDCLFKQHLRHRFQSASPRLTADVCLMASHLHCNLESPFGNNSSISNHRKPSQLYQNHLPWAIQTEALRGRICNHHIHSNYFGKVLGNKCVRVLKVPSSLLPNTANIFSVLLGVQTCKHWMFLVWCRCSCCGGVSFSKAALVCWNRKMV